LGLLREVKQTVGFVTQNKWILISYCSVLNRICCRQKIVYIVVGIISSQVEFQLRPYSQYREVKSRSGIVQNVAVVVSLVAITVRAQYGQDSVKSRHSTDKIA
jgi:heme/copper-type cytochrome/quinol oxidase subunit 4